MKRSRAGSFERRGTGCEQYLATICLFLAASCRRPDLPQTILPPFLIEPSLSVGPCLLYEPIILTV
jgi:hypothetical protein